MMGKHRFSSMREAENGNLFSVLYDGVDITGPQYLEVYVSYDFPDYAQVRLPGSLCAFVDSGGGLVPWSRVTEDRPGKNPFIRINGSIALKNGEDRERTKTFFRYSMVEGIYFEGRMVVKEFGTGLMGHIDREGIETTPLVYDYVAPFNNGMANVRKKDGNFGCVNLDGVLVIPALFRIFFDDFMSNLVEKDGCIKAIYRL